MVLGKWAWSTNNNHLGFIFFKDDHSCSFKNLNNEKNKEYDGHCRWKILTKSLKLKLTVPKLLSGNFIDLKLSRNRGL